MPFFWQRGEDEKTLRHYMNVIADSNCGAVCVESRPHPDFCGEEWWRDLDIILDEAKKLKMRVWILDDSHFPTGFCNGAIKNSPLRLRRKSVLASAVELTEEEADIRIDIMQEFPPEFHPTGLEEYVIDEVLKGQPVYDDDEVLSVTAVNYDTKEICPLLDKVRGGILQWKKPQGKWRLWITGTSRNCGPHRDYMNMMDPESVRVLIDAVYEPHYTHYKDLFGDTIAGFFSDEPEFGNGHLYWMQNYLGTDQDLPFSDILPDYLDKELGKSWKDRLFMLWDNDWCGEDAAKVRYKYMDVITSLVQENFSQQIGNWCKAHGVQYIGHVIEDDNVHARTGSGLGHYFRSLAGMDMAGIDDIGGQVLPQGEDEPTMGNMMVRRDGEFYHFGLAALAASAASIDPSKKGNSMCEIFGNYGWKEGVKLEKYLADHFMVRGINHYVPHAFSAAPFPDPDCPPHFYAHGHNPQYRHFGCLMKYMNRICTLISDGKRLAEAAILYHAESEWTGDSMLFQKPARKLAEAQIAYDIIPNDVFAKEKEYHTDLSKGLSINGRKYQVLIIPEAERIPRETVYAAKALLAKEFPVYFINSLPKACCDGMGNPMNDLEQARIVSLDNITGQVKQEIDQQAEIWPGNPYIRVLTYENGQKLYYLVNEGTETYEGILHVPNDGKCYQYDAWDNCIGLVEATYTDDYVDIKIAVEPLKSLIIVFGEAPCLFSDQASRNGEEITTGAWFRSVCESSEYPGFTDRKEITLPDRLAEEKPSFSGFVRYETKFTANKQDKIYLEIEDADEGVEVFINGKSLGIQIAPPYLYNLTGCLTEGENKLTVEVATTLQRQCWEHEKANPYTALLGITEPTGKTGLTGGVRLCASR